MPKVQSSLKSKIVEICKKYPDYSREGEDLYCNVCAHKINFNHTHGANVAKSHLGSKKTSKSEEFWENTRNSSSSP